MPRKTQTVVVKKPRYDFSEVELNKQISRLREICLYNADVGSIDYLTNLIDEMKAIKSTVSVYKKLAEKGNLERK